MKRIYLLFIAFMAIHAAMAQCTPDPTVTTPGIKPSKLPNGIVGVAYSEVITLKVPSDTSVMYMGTLYNAQIDSATVVEIKYMPQGFGYVCDKPSRTWNGGARGCAKLSGNPIASDTGDYVIYVKVRTFFKIVGLPNQLDQLDSSTIDFKVVMPSAIQELEQIVGLKTYPNPASQVLNVSVNNYAANANYCIYNLMGQKFDLTPVYSPNTGEIKFDISSLQSGVYFVKGENQGHSYQARFIKE